MRLGERIRFLREERGWRQIDLADRMNMANGSSVSDFETGRHAPNIPGLISLANAFGITVQDLLTDVDWVGALTNKGYPSALRELKDDPYWGPQLDDEWMRVLSRVEHQGRRPETTTDYLSIFLFLRRML